MYFCTDLLITILADDVYNISLEACVVLYFYNATGVTLLQLAGAERFERPSTVLETAILPLNYAPKYSKI